MHDHSDPPDEAITSTAPARATDGSLVRVLALCCICGLAAAVPTDYLVAFLLEANERTRTPSVYLSAVALLLSLPFLTRAALGRSIAPTLLISGSMFAAMVSLLTLRWSGEGSGPLGRLDWPFRLAAIALLSAFAASQRPWRRRLLWSYLVGWSAFVAVGIQLMLSGRAQVELHDDVARISLMGLNQNEQSVLIATGIVLLFDEMLVRGTVATTPLYLGALLAGGVVFVSGVSRSATLALACGLVVVLVAAARSGAASVARRAGKVAVLLTLLGVSAASVAERIPLVSEGASGLVTRMGDSYAGREFGQRDKLSMQAWRIAVMYPWHGVGYGRARELIGDDPHNDYLRIIAEGGALATLLLLAGLAMTASTLVRQVGRGHGAGPAAALVVLLVWSFAGHALLNMPFWFFLGVVAVGPEGDVH